MTDVSKIVGMVGAILVVSALIAVVLALPIMLCWNYLMPVVFGLPKITFVQALVMNILSALLFKSGAEAKSK